MQVVEALKKVDRSRWQTLSERTDIFAAWHSSKFTIQAFHVPGDIIRLSTNLNELSGTQRLYKDGISWDELQQIKDSCGYADRMAVEIYPEKYHVLNIINARHLWLLPNPLPFAWQNP
jgi:hypothetical protein